jgi:hypothetical protein
MKKAETCLGSGPVVEIHPEAIVKGHCPMRDGRSSCARGHSPGRYPGRGFEMAPRHHLALQNVAAELEHGEGAGDGQHGEDRDDDEETAGAHWPPPLLAACHKGNTPVISLNRLPVPGSAAIRPPACP